MYRRCFRTPHLIVIKAVLVMSAEAPRPRCDTIPHLVRTPSLLPSAGALRVTSGSSYCSIDANGCSTDGSGNHGNNERCTIAVNAAGTLTATSFSTESGYDYVTIGGQRFSGSTGPRGVSVAAGSSFSWHTDGSVTRSGWVICLAAAPGGGGGYCNINHDGMTNPCAAERSDYCCNSACDYCGPMAYCEQHSPFQAHSGVCNPQHVGGVCLNHFEMCDGEYDGPASHIGCGPPTPNVQEHVAVQRTNDFVLPGTAPHSRLVSYQSVPSEQDPLFDTGSSRLMTARAQDKLRILSQTVHRQHPSHRLQVLSAWTLQPAGESNGRPGPVHTGQAVTLQLIWSSGGVDHSLTHQLAATATASGFDWVAQCDNHVYASVRPSACQTDIDLLFLLDGSGSMDGYFHQELEFASQVLNYFDVGADGTRVAAITYASSSQSNFNFLGSSRFGPGPATITSTASPPAVAFAVPLLGLSGPISVALTTLMWLALAAAQSTMRDITRYSIQQEIAVISQPGGGTETNSALTMARSMFTVGNGARPLEDGVPRVCLLVTDGNSNDRSSTVLAASRLKADGVSVFAIGAGSIDLAELRDVASTPVDEHLFLIDSAADIVTLVDSMAETTCEEPAQVLPCGHVVQTVEAGDFKYFHPHSAGLANEIVIEATVEAGHGISVFASGSDPNPGRYFSDISDSTSNVVKLITTNRSALPGSELYVSIQGDGREQSRFRLTIYNVRFTVVFYVNFVAATLVSPPSSSALSLKYPVTADIAASLCCFYFRTFCRVDSGSLWMCPWICRLELLCRNHQLRWIGFFLASHDLTASWCSPRLSGLIHHLESSVSCADCIPPMPMCCSSKSRVARCLGTRATTPSTLSRV